MRSNKRQKKVDENKEFFQMSDRSLSDRHDEEAAIMASNRSGRRSKQGQLILSSEGTTDGADDQGARRDPDLRIGKKNNQRDSYDRKGRQGKNNANPRNIFTRTETELMDKAAGKKRKSKSQPIDALKQDQGSQSMSDSLARDDEKMSDGMSFDSGSDVDAVNLEKPVLQVLPSEFHNQSDSLDNDEENYQEMDQDVLNQLAPIHEQEMEILHAQRRTYRNIHRKKNSLMSGQSVAPRSYSFVARDPSELKKNLELIVGVDEEANVKKNFSNDDLFDEKETQQADDATTAHTKTNFLTKPLEGMQNFTMMYAMPLAMSTQPKCIILPSSKTKLVWDIFILAALLLVSILVPFRLAYYPEDDETWMIIYGVIDTFFLIDIIVTFFTATLDQKSNVVQVDKKVLAKQYLAFWFWVDVIAILPMDVIMRSGAEANILLRFAKIGKLYKLIRLSRLAKLFKLLKGSNAVFSQLSSSMMLSSGVERLVFIGIFAIFFLHISSCLFVFLSEFDDETDDVWRFNEPYLYYDKFDLYVTSVYYVVTTMSTVGYGDISGGTMAERIFCIALMLTGVISFNLISGALGALITNYDSSQAALQEKLLQLNNLKMKYKINNELYFQIKKALQYDHSANMTGLDMFINGLPDKLRLDISEEIHRDNLNKFTFFADIGGQNFLAWVASKLRPRFETENVAIYEKGDYIDNFYFATRGVFCFVIPEQRNAIYGVVDPEKVQKTTKTTTKDRILQYFGIEDSIVNCTARIHDNLNYEDCFQFSSNGIKDPRKRFFQVLSITHTQSLSFAYSDIDSMKRDFALTSKDFFKMMMQQTKRLLYFQLAQLQNSDQSNCLLVKRSNTEKREQALKNQEVKTLEERNMEVVNRHMLNQYDALDGYSSIHFSESSSSYASGHEDESESSDSNSIAKLSREQETPFDEFNTPRNHKSHSQAEEFKKKSSLKEHTSPFAALSGKDQSEPAPSLSNFSSPDVKMHAMGKLALLQTEPKRSNSHQGVKGDAESSDQKFRKSVTQSDRKISMFIQGVDEKGDSKAVNESSDSKMSPHRMHSGGTTSSDQKLSETRKSQGKNLGKNQRDPSKSDLQGNRQRRKSHYVPETAESKKLKNATKQSLGDSGLDSNQNGNDQELDSQFTRQESNQHRQRKHKSYDLVARQKFKKKMQAEISKHQQNEIHLNLFNMKHQQPNLLHSPHSHAEAEKQSVRLSSNNSLQNIPQELPRVTSQDVSVAPLLTHHTSQSHTDQFLQKPVPDLSLQKLDSGVDSNLKIQSQDDNDDIASSERRDAVASLRESKQPFAEQNRPLGGLPFGQLGAFNNTQNNKRQSSKSMPAPDRAGLQLKKKKSSTDGSPSGNRRRSTLFKKKETELEFTRRLWDENPEGIKGLAYVLVEIRRAIDDGIIKPKVTKAGEAGGRGIGKFADMFGKVADTRLQNTERLKELLNSLNNHKTRILDHVLKEQDFNNEEPIIEKNEIFLERMVKNNRKTLDQFFQKLDSRMQDMQTEIGQIKSRVDKIQQDRVATPN